MLVEACRLDMLAKRTIKFKVLELRKGKAELLLREYLNFQRYLHGDKSVLLYSATRQQGERILKRIGSPKERKEYPLILRRDVYRLEKTENKLTEYWLRVPIGGVDGGIWIPLKAHAVIPEGVSLREAKIVRRNDCWFVFLTVQSEVEERKASSVLAVDLGVHNVATTVNSTDKQVQFYGNNIRLVRGHYYHLRRNLPNRKAVKKVGKHERRIVAYELHVISKAIVEDAAVKNSVIVVGKLKGIRKQRKFQSRRSKRKVASFPFYKLTQFIKYKAAWKGISVVEVSEAYTSVTCSHCGCRGVRVRGLFRCPECGCSLNADLNGARNILKRALGKSLVGPLSGAGACLAVPELLAEAKSL
jgi:putative transposase